MPAENLIICLKLFSVWHFDIFVYIKLKEFEIHLSMHFLLCLQTKEIVHLSTSLKFKFCTPGQKWMEQQNAYILEKIYLKQQTGKQPAFFFEILPSQKIKKITYQT